MDNIFMRKNEQDPEYVNPIQLDKTAALFDINEKFKMMGWTPHAEEDLQKVAKNEQYTYKATLEHDMVEMALINAEQAALIKKHFPEISDKAEAKMDNLVEQSQYSGMQKVKKDFFGKKRKAAREELERIKAKKITYDEKLKKAEKEHFDDKSVERTSAIRQREEELNEKIANEKDPEIKAAYEKCLSDLKTVLSGKKEDETERDMTYRLHQGSEYTFRNNRIAAGVKKRLPASNSADELTSGLSRLAMPFEIHTRDVSEYYGVNKYGLTPEEENFDYEKDVEKVTRLTNNLNIVRKGEQEKPVQQKAVKEIITSLGSKVDQFRMFEEVFSKELFVQNPSIYNVDSACTDIKAALDTLKICQGLSDELIDSEAFKSLSKTDREAAGKTFLYLKTMKSTLQELDLWNKKYQDWAKNQNGNMPELGNNFDYFAETYSNELKSKLDNMG